MKRLFLILLSICLFSCSKNKLNENPKKEINKFHDLAYSYRDNGKTDSAFFYFIKAKDLYTQRNDSLGIVNCLANLAIISTDIGDYFNGQELSLNAISYLNVANKQHRPYLHYNYNNIGLASYRMKDYDNAIKYYDLALKFSEDSLDTRLYLNNKAKVYQELKQYQKALNIYRQLSKLASKNQKEYARSLTNLAMTEWLLNRKNIEVLPKLLKALHIREKEQDLWGQNSSYANISDYYADINLDSALFYANKMYAVAKKLNSPDDQLLAFQKLTKLNKSPKNNVYFEAYLNLADSVQTARNHSKNQFALIRFETEKHKADKLVLQKENAEKKYQIIIITAVSALTLVVGLFWYRKRRQHMKLIAEKTIKENQLKLSKKVHDVVANGLYRVMTEIENQNEIDKERILDKIEDMYEKSRDISYDQIEKISNSYHHQINSLLSSFSSSNLVIEVTGNTPTIWQKTGPKVQYEIEHVLQELMVNMVKHSQATSVKVDFEQLKQEISIRYVDNGIGITNNTQFRNGLTNTGTRINNIFGNIIFDSQTERGLEIHISFPIS